MNKLALVFLSAILLTQSASNAAPSVASAGYVNQTITDHTSNKANPHNVTAEQVGLGDVKNVDTTNANNITSGQVALDRLPVGNTANTIAAGDDARFYAISASQPNITAPEGMVLVWFE